MKNDKIGTTVLINLVLDMDTHIIDTVVLNKLYIGSNTEHLLLMAELEGYKYYVKQDNKLLVGGQ